MSSEERGQWVYLVAIVLDVRRLRRHHSAASNSDADN